MAVDQLDLGRKIVTNRRKTIDVQIVFYYALRSSFSETNRLQGYNSIYSIYFLSYVCYNNFILKLRVKGIYLEQKITNSVSRVRN